MTAVQDLMNHPRTFLRNNILMVLGPTGGTGGKKPARLRLTATTGYNALTGGITQMPVYSLSVGRTDGPGDACEVYWCPYDKNAFLGTTLPGVGGQGEPNVMFTYGMDGCTFVAGSVTADKTVSVHHVNYASLGASDGIDQQRKLQRNVGKSQVTNAQTIDPDDYYEKASFENIVFPPKAKISTITFGRRSSNDGWKFYTHQYYTVLNGDLSAPKHYIGTTRYI
jgi:hypothetical protein